METAEPYFDAETGVVNGSLFNRWGIILAYLIPVAVLLSYRFSLPAVICDDAYITFKTARNLAEGNGLVFNLGERLYLLTTPLWAFLIAAGRILGADVISVAKFLGILFELAFLCSTVYLGIALTGRRSAGMLAAVLVCTNPVFLLTSFSGMELPLYLFLVILTFILLAKERYSWSLVIASIAVWTRFDGILLFALVLCWVLMIRRRELGNSAGRIFIEIIPSIVLVGGYLFFGYIYYGDAIPTSVQRKVLASPLMFSETWWQYATLVFRELINAFHGKSAYWYIARTQFWIFWAPLVIGLISLIAGRNRRMIPLLVFTFLYALSLIGSGNSYALNFPWYFVPVLPGLYLLSAWGCVLVLSWIFRRLIPIQSSVPTGVIITLGVIIWSFIMFAPLQKDRRNLTGMSVDRERMYGAVAIWLGNHLEKKSTIAATEFGAVGFFSRPDIAILDLFGILRANEDRWVSTVDLMLKYRPEAVITRVHFKVREQIDKEMEGEYFWYEVKTVEIGLRRDLAPKYAREFDELENIYLNLEVGREYGWGEN